MRTISVTAVRRLAIAAQGYASRGRNGTAREVEDAIRGLSCVQLDSITAVERSHRIVLGSQSGRLSEGDRVPPARRGPDLRVLGARGLPHPGRGVAALPAGDAPGPSLAGRRHRTAPRARRGGACGGSGARPDRVARLRRQGRRRDVELEAGQGHARGALEQRRDRDRRASQRVPAAVRPRRARHPAATSWRRRCRTRPRGSAS